jgi:hypothetical protein
VRVVTARTALCDLLALLVGSFVHDTCPDLDSAIDVETLRPLGFNNAQPLPKVVEVGLWRR